MSGLLALLDDVSAIAKIASASVDDVIKQAAKAGSKAAGAVIDDAAVTPKYVDGFAAARELPIVWKIARASIFNKVVILLPAAVLLSLFAPWMIPPLLILGGAYLCYEGAEKVKHWLDPPDISHVPIDEKTLDAAHLEEQKVKGAIKTDFILSAEIMTIALSTLTPDVTLWTKVAVLLVVAVGMTVAVYGSVALIVKADDVGLHLAAEGRTALGRRFGAGLVKAMPGFMRLLTIVGTAAMLWVGGNIVVHALHEMGWHLPYDLIKAAAGAGASLVPAAAGLVAWTITAAIDGVLGLILGFALIPLVHGALRAMGREEAAGY
jgi:predicted DNA repair protein MutK